MATATACAPGCKCRKKACFDARLAARDRAQTPQPRPPRKPRTKPCVHFGDTLRDADGRAVEKKCGTCPGSPRHTVHACRKGHGEVTAADCGRCADYESPPDVRTFFARAVVLNLKRRADRLAEFRSEPWPFPVEVFEAVDGSVSPPPDTFVSPAGAWGCLRSHQLVLERALADGAEPLLVLEDDAVVRPDFAAKLEEFLQAVPDDWDQLMLGGQHMGGSEPVKPGVVRCLNCQRTHAYVIRGAMLRDLYREWCSSRTNRHCDHVMGPFQSRFRVYAPDPFLVGQRRSRSDITHGHNPEKWWIPPTGKEAVYLLHCPPDVVKGLRKRHGVHTGHNRDRQTDVDNGLRHLFSLPPEYHEAKLRKWVSDLQWECVSGAGVLGVWHPQATAELLRRCWGGPVVEVAADTVEAAAAQLKESP